MLYKREDIEMAVAAGATSFNDLPAWIKIATPLVFLAYVLGTTAIQYIYGGVLTTLTAIESPDSTAFLTTSPYDEADAPLPPYSDKESDVKEPLVRQEILLVDHKPITASCRGTLAHIRQNGGSVIRGAGVFMLYGFLMHLISGFFTSFRSWPMHIVGFIVSQVVLTRLALLWVHIVISKPSTKRWYQRAVPRSVAKKAIKPTFAFAVAQVAIPLVPAAVFEILSVGASLEHTSLPEMSSAERASLALKVLAVSLSGILYFCGIVIPMAIALTRSYAALLPEDESPIVPFDRTFGGLVVSEAEGGRGNLKLKDAWKSFDWNARVRLIKVWVKMTGLLIATTVGFIMVNMLILAGHVIPQIRQTSTP